MREPVKLIAVERETRALKHDGAVPGKTMRFECAQDGIGMNGAAARRVDVLHSHQPTSARRTGFAVAGKGGEEGTKVERAGRARRKAPGGGWVHASTLAYKGGGGVRWTSGLWAKINLPVIGRFPKGGDVFREMKPA